MRREVICTRQDFKHGSFFEMKRNFCWSHLLDCTTLESWKQIVGNPANTDYRIIFFSFNGWNNRLWYVSPQKNTLTAQNLRQYLIKLVFQLGHYVWTFENCKEMEINKPNSLSLSLSILPCMLSTCIYTCVCIFLFVFSFFFLFARGVV